MGEYGSPEGGGHDRAIFLDGGDVFMGLGVQHGEGAGGGRQRGLVDGL